MERETWRAEVHGVAKSQTRLSNSTELKLNWYLKYILLVCMLLTQSSPTLCNPMDCNTQGSSIHGTLQARILEWVAISFSREPSRSRD